MLYNKARLTFVYGKYLRLNIEQVTAYYSIIN